MTVFRSLLLCLLLLSAQAGLAADLPERSLFFTREEEEILRAALRGMKIANPENLDKEEEVVEIVKPRQTNIHLSALLYAGKDNWVAWINGARITPGFKTVDFAVSAVTERYVELVPAWREDVKFRLAPLQTYIAETGEIVEGKVK